MSGSFFKPAQGDGRGGVSPEYTFRRHRLPFEPGHLLWYGQHGQRADVAPQEPEYDGPKCDGWHDGRPCPDPDCHAIVEVVQRVQVSRGLRAKCNSDHGITTCTDPDCYRRLR